MKKVENSEKVVKTHRPEVPVNSDLLDALKALRKGIASKRAFLPMLFYRCNAD